MDRYISCLSPYPPFHIVSSGNDVTDAKCELVRLKGAASVLSGNLRFAVVFPKLIYTLNKDLEAKPSPYLLFGGAEHGQSSRQVHPWELMEILQGQNNQSE